MVTKTLHLAHLSMQFSDTPNAQRSDSKKAFRRCADRKVTSFGGTEAGPGSDLMRYLRDAADDNGYRFYHTGSADTWVAVARDDIVKGSYSTGYVPVLKPTDGQGKHTGRGITWASWVHPTFGRMTHGSCHYLTNGARPSQPNYRFNQQLTYAIERWGIMKGRSKAIVLYSGDQNIQDRTLDTFMGAPFTSAWDELKKYDNTGHGNIDVIASYNKDKRVEAKYCRALDDKEFHLYSDHFMVEAGYEVELLPSAV